MPQASAEFLHVLAGAALALGFALLVCRRAPTLARVVGTQSIAVTAASAWQAWTLHAFGLAGLALAVLFAGAALARGLHRRSDAPEHAPPAQAALAAAAALVVLALLAVPSAQLPGLPPIRENLALALATVLLGLKLLATRRSALAQLAGLQALANGVALAAAVAGAAPPAALAVIALFGFLAIGLAMRPAPGDAA